MHAQALQHIGGGTTVTFEQLWAELLPVGRVRNTGGYRRQPFTSAEREAHAWFLEQCRCRELRVEHDGFGNVVAWWDTGSGPGVLTGSHLDSVVDGGAYDGPLGVVSALAALDLLRDRGVVPSRPLGVGVFIEEEGSRWPVACLGSRLATGALGWQEARGLRDRDGVALGDVVAGPEGERSARTSATLGEVGAYVELHVEQGRGLVDLDASVGIAGGIWPHGRYRYEFTGAADHAGTTRMQDRHDPMLTYAMTVLAANKQARVTGQRATFGRVAVRPGAVNAIPSAVTGWLDARARSAPELEALVAAVQRLAAERAERDGTDLEVTAESVTAAVEFDQGLTQRIDPDQRWPVISTAAGHDAGILAGAGVPTAMLFVRNPTGVSHSPAEHAEPADCLTGVAALADALERLATQEQPA